MAARQQVWLTLGSTIGRCAGSPEYWTCPNDFDPDRFPLDAPVPNEVTENFAYLPLWRGQAQVHRWGPSIVFVEGVFWSLFS